MPKTSAAGLRPGCTGTNTSGGRVLALVPDILESWRHPARVARRHLSRPASEPFVFTFLFVFLLIAFVAQWPQASRASFLDPSVPMVQRLYAAGLGLLATIPLWYGLAALSHLAARAMGGRGGWYGARLALFWALACMAPGMLLMGLVLGFIGPGTQASLLGGLIGLAFLWLWLTMLREVERG